MTENDEKLEKGIALANKLFAGVVRAESVPLPDDLRRDTMEDLVGDLWQGQDRWVDDLHSADRHGP